MKIIRYIVDGDPQPKVGCIDGNQVYHLIGDPLRRAKQGEYITSLKSIRLVAPCLPRKIIALAINFPGIDGFSLTMEEPMVFIKPRTSVCGLGTIISNPFPNLPMWGEAELGVVIRDVPKNATPLQVEEGILGFTIGNDTTVENVDGRDHHLARSKCPDNFCPIGPWIDTDFDASDCLIEAIQNGEVIRRGRSSEQVWQWPQIVAWLSTWISLDPWDVILTGNPPDTVGMRYIQNGDIFTARIEGLGELTNHYEIKGR
jgi:2-keto-4-pentenoate hydratase/2-oxohepta-3-ene-1,7-dioic acid hydratase in catechol pathway